MLRLGLSVCMSYECLLYVCLRYVCMHVLCMYDCVSCMYVCMYVVLLFKQNCHLAMEIRVGKRVTHWKSLRSGQVLRTLVPRAGKMWVEFDDGALELRWVTAFVEEVEKQCITPVPKVPETVKQSGSSACSHVCMYACMYVS